MSAPPVLIRLARPDEQSALEALQMRASLALDDYREALTAHPDAVETPLRQFERGHVLVAETGGGVAGFAALEIAAEGEPELDGLFVEPDQWGRGLGARLVAAAEDLLIAQGGRALSVVANPRAEAFYRRCGFEVVGEAPTRFGPAILMRKTLT